MAVSELTQPTSVLAVLGEPDVGGLVANMAARLPPGGLLSGLAPSITLRSPTRRLLDERILVAAVGALEQDVALPLLAWLAKLRRVSEGAVASVMSKTDQTVVIEGGRTLAQQWITVSLEADGSRVATVVLQLVVTVDVGEVAAVLSRGALGEATARRLSLSASLGLEGLSAPLWASNAVLLTQAHLVARPAVRVPVVPVPRRVSADGGTEG